MEVLILKFETIIKIQYTLEPEEIKQLNSISPFHKRQFIHMAKQEIMELIQDNVESDRIEVSITVYE
jgi:hypothetical protein